MDLHRHNDYDKILFMEWRSASIEVGKWRGLPRLFTMHVDILSCRPALIANHVVQTKFVRQVRGWTESSISIFTQSKNISSHLSSQFVDTQPADITL